MQSFKRVFFDFLITWAFFLDLALFVFFFVVSCFLCNSTFSAGSPCNAPLNEWCQAFGPDHPDRCKPGPVTIEPCHLAINHLFVDWIIFVAVLSILDFILYLLNNEMSGYINQYLDKYVVAKW